MANTFTSLHFHVVFSTKNRPDLSENIGLSFARFSVLLFPHHYKERFVTAVVWNATR